MWILTTCVTVRSKQISQLFIPEEAGYDTSFDALGESRFHGMDSVNRVNMGLLPVVKILVRYYCFHHRACDFLTGPLN